MKIIVISDTHGNYDVMENIVSSNPSADTFIHLGDGEREFGYVQNKYPAKAFIMVRGNCDYGDHPQVRSVSLGGKSFFLTHGHAYGRSPEPFLLAANARNNGCIAALFGHTHVPMNEEHLGIRLFNPGSPVLPRGGHKPSYGVITVDEDGNVGFSITEL